MMAEGATGQLCASSWTVWTTVLAKTFCKVRFDCWFALQKFSYVNPNRVHSSFWNRWNACGLGRRVAITTVGGDLVFGEYRLYRRALELSDCVRNDSVSRKGCVVFEYDIRTYKLHAFFGIVLVTSNTCPVG